MVFLGADECGAKTLSGRRPSGARLGRRVGRRLRGGWWWWWSGQGCGGRGAQGDGGG